MFITHLSLSYLPILITAFIFLQVVSFVFSLSYGLTYTLFPVLSFFLLIAFYFILFYYSEEFRYSYKLYIFYLWFFYLFLVSEVFFFFGIFWSMFWNVYAFSSIDTFFLIYQPITPWGLAFVNTLLLLFSSCLCNIYHLSTVMSGAYWMGDIKFVLGAVVVGIIFLFFQFIEIYLSGFNITQLGYSSCFFLATGFHGFHVLLGAFLLICLYSNRIIDNLIDSFFIFQSKVIHLHTFATATILYWHFVDVIWIGLYYFLYFLPFVFVV